MNVSKAIGPTIPKVTIKIWALCPSFADMKTGVSNHPPDPSGACSIAMENG
jgi:hypothetical protein